MNRINLNHELVTALMTASVDLYCFTFVRQCVLCTEIMHVFCAADFKLLFVTKSTICVYYKYSIIFISIMISFIYHEW